MTTDLRTRLQSLRTVLGIDSPEVRGWAPAVQQEARRTLDAAIAALAAAPSTSPAAAAVAGEPDQLEQACHEATFARELLAWSYTKLHYRSFDNMDDALQLDRIKLYLEHGVAG